MQYVCIANVAFIHFNFVIAFDFLVEFLFRLNFLLNVHLGAFQDMAFYRKQTLLSGFLILRIDRQLFTLVMYTS